MSKEVYLDNSATTRICDEALEKYVQTSRECYGNPSSLHTLGFKAEKILDAARDEVKAALGSKDIEVIFTASGSEANNLAIFGRTFSKERFAKGAKIITTEGEHASVNEPFSKLENLGFKVAKIPTKGGKIDMEVLRREMTRDVILVSMMMVNNETGALYDVQAVSKIMRSSSPDALLHVDATQSFMKIPFTLSSIGADMITLSSHKIEGPKGVGALAVSKSVIKSKSITPLTLGGGQEGGLRSGTENVPAIAAFGEAVRIARANLRDRYTYLCELRTYLIEKLGADELRDISITLPERTAPQIVNITLPKIKSETMLHYLSSFGIYVSSGSACSSNSSHVSSALTAYGRTDAEADSSVRISLSHRNTREDIDLLCEALASGLSKLSRMK